MKSLKDMSKRGLALFLALVMCLGMVNVTALAVEEAPEAPQVTSVVFDCGQEEHEHTEACYETETTPEAPEDGEAESEEIPEEPAPDTTEEPSIAPDETVEPAEPAEPVEETQPETETTVETTEDVEINAEPAETVTEPVAEDEGEPQTEPEAEDEVQGEMTYTADAPLVTEPEAPAEIEVEAEAERNLVCGKEEHLHSAQCCEAGRDYVDMSRRTCRGHFSCSRNRPGMEIRLE